MIKNERKYSKTNHVAVGNLRKQNTRWIRETDLGQSVLRTHVSDWLSSPQRSEPARLQYIKSWVLDYAGPPTGADTNDIDDDDYNGGNVGGVGSPASLRADLLALPEEGSGFRIGDVGPELGALSCRACCLGGSIHRGAGRFDLTLRRAAR